MNRPICFRAVTQGKDKHWVYGYIELYQNPMGKIPATMHTFSDWGLNTSVNVDSDTIGQYTGLKDKKGKDIYEGDIIRIGGDLVEEVKWITQKDWIDISKTNPCPFVGFVNHFNIYNKDIEVIGNIYQNKELLK